MIPARLGELSDADLLALTRSQPEAFGVFYRRHVDWVLRVSARRTGSREHAADLAAETFAAALLAAPRFRPGRGAPNNWLFGILLNKLAGFERRGAVEDRARRRLRLERTPSIDESEFERLLDATSDDPGEAARLLAMLDALPAPQRSAVRGRVLEERSYAEIAAAEQTSQANVRQRVSRGLATLRDQILKETQ